MLFYYRIAPKIIETTGVHFQVKLICKTIIFSIFYFGIYMIGEYYTYCKALKGFLSFFCICSLICELDEALLTHCHCNSSQYWPSADSRRQWSPTFLALGTHFFGRQFSTDHRGGGRGVRGWFWDDPSTLHLLCTLLLLNQLCLRSPGIRS